jgi:hypothetical protein
VGRAPEADSSVEAAVALGEAASTAVASGPPDMLPALAPAAVEVVVVLAVELPVAADACRRFDSGGSLDRRVNCRRVPQPRWVDARRSAKGGKPVGDRRKTGNPRPSCLSRAQVGCACSRGLQASAWEGARGLRARRPILPARPTLPKRALHLPFIGVRRGSRCTMGDVAAC